MHGGTRDSDRQAAPSTTPGPTSAATSQVAAAPKPRPKPYRLMYSTTLAAPTAEARHTRVFTVLPSGQGKLRRIGASTVPLSQVNPVTGLVVTTKVLSQTTSWMPSAGYCNAWSCPESGTTSTEQGLVLRNPRNGTSRILTRGGYDDTPVWSPDGSTIAYDSLRRSGHVIALVGPAGEDLGTVAQAPAGSFDSSPVWAPNNQAVAAVRTNR